MVYLGYIKTRVSHAKLAVILQQQKHEIDIAENLKMLLYSRGATSLPEKCCRSLKSFPIQSQLEKMEVQLEGREAVPLKREACSLHN